MLRNSENKEMPWNQIQLVLNFQVWLTEKVALTLVVTVVSMPCLNLLASRLNVNRQERNLFHV